MGTTRDTLYISNEHDLPVDIMKLEQRGDGGTAHGLGSRPEDHHSSTLLGHTHDCSPSDNLHAYPYHIHDSDVKKRIQVSASGNQDPPPIRSRLGTDLPGHWAIPPAGPPVDID